MDKNRSIFNKNVRIFESKFPDFFRQLKNAPDPAGFLIEEARNGKPTLCLNTENKKIMVHSKYDPEKEAERWAESLGNSWDTLVVFGLGLGYHLLAARKLYPERKIILVEKSFAHIHLPMHYVDLTPLWRGNLEIIIGAEGQRAGYTAGVYLAQNLSKDFIFRALPVYENIFSRYWTAFNEEISTAIKSVATDFATRQEFKGAWYTNFRDNFISYIKTPGVNRLFQEFKKRPAIIVSAGPSLDKNIHLLPDLKDKAFIMAAGSSVLQMIHHEIRPHLIVSFDPGKYNWSVFSEITDEDIPLAFASNIFPVIVRHYGGPKLTFNIDVFTDWFEKKSGLEKGTLTSGGTVAVLCFDLAVKMGCDPIIFIGQDLAYTRGLTHASGVEHSQKIDIIENSAFQVEGVDGPVYTNSKMWTMKGHLEEKIAIVGKKRKIINATEGGLKILGTENLTLKETANQFCRDTFDVNEIIKKALETAQPYTEANRDQLLALVEVLLREKRNFEDSFVAVINHAKALNEKLTEGSVKEFYIEKTIKEIKKRVREVEEMTIYQNFISKMMQDEMQMLSISTNRKIARAETPAVKTQEIITGYAMMFHNMMVGATFLEREILSGIRAYLMGMELTTDKTSPSRVGDTIKLIAKAGFSAEPLYRFFVRIKEKEGKKELVQEYSPANEHIWRPEKSGQYILIAEAKDKASSLEFDTIAIIKYMITD